MNRNDAIAKLEGRASTIKEMGATALYIFGSTARDEAHLSSDLDIFIDHDNANNFTLLDLIGIKQFLEDELSIKVDITTRSSLHPVLRPDIEQSAVRVF